MAGAAQPVWAQAILNKPQTGLKVTHIVIRSAGGQTHRFKAEIAKTEGQQEIGMMFRTSVPRGTGMIFPHDPPRQAGFWMRNTLVGLDIIYIAPGGRIESIHSPLPLTETPVFSTGPVEAVLEIGAGEAARLGIRAGDRVEWRTGGR